MQYLKNLLLLGIILKENNYVMDEDSKRWNIKPVSLGKVKQQVLITMWFLVVTWKSRIVLKWWQNKGETEPLQLAKGGAHFLAA